MKNTLVTRCFVWPSLLAWCCCVGLSGCMESSSGMLYSELPKPKGATFTTWQPLADSDVEATAPTIAPTDQSQESGTKAAEPGSAEESGQKSAAEPAEATSDQSSEPDEASQDTSESAEVLEMKLLIPEKRFRKEDGGKVTRVSYDDIDLLKILNMQPVPADAADHFPDWLNSLDGLRIRIRGFMIPPFQAQGLKRFALARDNGICCFVRTPKIYDVIDVRMAEGQTTHYIANTPFDVEGTFRIQPIADEGELYKLYKIEDANVIE